MSHSTGAAGCAALMILLLGTAQVVSSQEPADDRARESENGRFEPSPPQEITLDVLPFDRITLTDGRVIDCEPLDPRPLGELKPRDEIEIRPLDLGGQLFKVPWFQVEKVEYYEDLLLQKADQFIKERRFPEAFDYLSVVHQRAPDWPGLAEQIERLLFQEAADALQHLHAWKAFNLLAELHGRNPDYPELPTLVGQAVDQLVGSAFQREDYRSGRWALSKTAENFANHPVVEKWRQRYQEAARQLVDQALSEEQAGRLSQAARLIQRAAIVWPRLPSLAEHLTRIGTKYPLVVVAVEELPADVGRWPSTHAQRRASSLVHLPILERHPSPQDDRFDSALVEDFQKSNLGMRVRFKLRSDRWWSDGHAPITAGDVARTLLDRTRRSLPGHDPLWSQLLKSVQIHSLFELTVDFAQQPLQPELWFQVPVIASDKFNIGPAMAEKGQTAGSQRAAPEAVLVVSGPFIPTRDSDASKAVYHANPHYPPAEQPQIKEIVEWRLPNPKALEALVQGLVMVVEHVAPWQVEQVRQAPGLKVDRYAPPRVHFIGFDLQRPELRNRTLRRALVYAIDRPLIFQQLLQNNADKDDILLSGPFQRGSYASNPSVQPRPHDPLLAQALLAAVRRQFGDSLPRLKLHHPPNEVAREACRYLQAYWKQVGIDVQTVEITQAELLNALRAGRPMDLVYRIEPVMEPVLEAAELLAIVPPANEAPWDHVPSAWLRRRLIELGQASDWPAARAILNEVHQLAHDDMAIIPLWQMTDYFAYHRQLHDIGSNLLSLYHNVEQWRLTPQPPEDPLPVPEPR